MPAIELKNIIQNTKWHFWHIRKRSPLFVYIMWLGASIKKLNNFSYKMNFGGSCLDNMLTKESELKKYGDNIWQHFKKDNSALLNIMNSAYLKNQKDIKQWNNLSRINFKELNNQKLLTLYNQYIDSLLDYGPYIFNPLAAEAKMTDACIKYLKLKFSNDWQKYEAVVMRPIQKSHTLLQKEFLLKIATKNKSDQKKLLDKHVEKFSFLKSKEFFMDFFDKDYYQNEISKIDKPKANLKKIITENKKHQKEFYLLLNKIKDDTYGQQLLKTVNEAIFFRTWRTEKLVHSSFYAKPLFREISNRIELENEKQLVYLLPSEVNDYLKIKKIFPKKLIDDRIQAYILLTVNKKGDYVFVSGKNAIKIGGKIKFSDTSENSMSGHSAHRGLVTGRAVVIISKTEYDKIINGDILITHSTVPDMVPYMKKVKAIVAEEGGILSHAALISRELKIPCVIGVKNITKILKDNDMIKVDANIGKITKLSN